MSSRRNVVSKTVLAIAGLAGLGAASGGTGKLIAGSEPSTFVLHGRNWRTNNDPMAALPSEGDRISVRGDLIDESHGERIGDFFAAGFAIGGGLHPAQGERLELHTFKLPEGTIIGSGTAGQLEGVFAILGGTGRYASARGTYVARQRHQDLGGDGSAEFLFKLTR
jgi:hypothetical protein